MRTVSDPMRSGPTWRWLCLVVGFLALLSSPRALAWENDAWGARVKITFDNSGQAQNLVSFPVLIKLDSSRIEYFRTQDAGQDIRFVDADDTTVLDHEIEVWDEAGTSYVWVRVPQIDALSSVDFIYMYYDNVNAADVQNPTGVWNANYRGVWHLAEDPSGPPPQTRDSTSSGLHGTSGGVMTAGDQVGGQIDGSLDFDGSDDVVATGVTNVMANLASFTMSAWVAPRAGQPDFAGIVEYDDSGGGSNFEAGIEMRPSGVPRVNIFTTAGFQFADSATVLPTTGWSHLVFVYDGSNLLLYIDGALDTTSPPITGNTRNINRPIHIGRNTHDGRYFDGLIDEVQISDTPRSADWIRAQHASTTDTFATFEAPVAGPCCQSLTTSEALGEITVTSPASFEMVFRRSAGGALDSFWDLAEDPTRLYDLAGKPVPSEFRGLFHASFNAAASLYVSGQNNKGPKLDLLESGCARRCSSSSVLGPVPGCCPA